MGECRYRRGSRYQVDTTAHAQQLDTMTDVDTIVVEAPVAIQDHLILDNREATETVENIASSAQCGRKLYSRMEKAYEDKENETL